MAHSGAVENCPSMRPDTKQFIIILFSALQTNPAALEEPSKFICREVQFVN